MVSATLPTSTFNGIDTQVIKVGAAGQPLRDGLNVERLAVGHARHADAGEPHQRVLRALHLRATRNCALRLLGADDAVFTEPLDQLAPVERAGEEAFCRVDSGGDAGRCGGLTALMGGTVPDESRSGSSGPAQDQLA